MVLFTLAEVTLVVLTFTKSDKKSAWLRNRTIVRAIETALLLGIILLPVTAMKWRFLFALGILIIRLIAAGIEWLTHYNDTGIRKKAGAIVCCIVSIAMMTVSVAPALPYVNLDRLSSSKEFHAEKINDMIAERLAKEFLTEYRDNDNSQTHLFK